MAAPLRLRGSLVGGPHLEIGIRVLLVIRNLVALAWVMLTAAAELLRFALPRELITLAMPVAAEPAAVLPTPPPP